jgi:hypothetical protein
VVVIFEDDAPARPDRLNHGTHGAQRIMQMFEQKARMRDIK